MPGSFQALWNQILAWTHSYGYHAVVPTLVADPAGVPWAWIFLLLIAEQAQLNVYLMLGYGFGVLTVCDHLLYFLGAKGGRPLVNKLGKRWPKIAHSVQAAEEAMAGRELWAIALGRYIPVIGRWVGMGAGLANVPYLRFVIFDAIGVALTTIGFGLIAHFAGRSAIDQPWFPHVVLGSYIASTILTALITFWQGWRLKKRRDAMRSAAS